MPENRIPEPPPGYIPFKWKTRANKTQRDVVENLCPVCGEAGSVWGGKFGPDMGFQDQKVVQFLNNLRKEKGLEGDDYLFYSEEKGHYVSIWDVYYEGESVKSHWSRYGVGECRKCGVKFWHDFIGYPWHYYYDPGSAKVSHTYQPALF